MLPTSGRNTSRILLADLNSKVVGIIFRASRLLQLFLHEKEFSPASDAMIDRPTKDFLDLSSEGQELKHFFQRLRQAGQLVVRDGSDEFVVELRRTTLTSDARRRLTDGGPEA